MKKSITIYLIFASLLAQGQQQQQQEQQQFFTPPKSVYYVKIHKIADTVISIVASLNSFLNTKLVTQNNETMSLLDFEYRENSDITVEAYERVKHFGGWVKNKKSGDCFNTRNKVLVRDNIGTITLKESNKCSVAQGLWVDAYSGNEMTDAQAEIQIDHMVPLHEAYISGGYKWTFKERCLYGNYLGYKNHLLPVSGEENNNKSSSTPAEYMPPKKEYQCEYLKDWLKIKSIWGLSLTSEEMKAVNSLVEESNCDKAKFVITRKELEEQSEFFEKNSDLCRIFDNNKNQ